MIIGLLLLAVGLLAIQLSSAVRSVAAIVDVIGLLFLFVAGTLLLLQSTWFVLSLLPALGLLAATLNRYHGVAARRDLAFPLEVQWLSVALTLPVGTAWTLDFTSAPATNVVQVVLIGLLAIALVLHILLSVHLRRYRLGPTKQLALSDLDSLPTVSLLIPARNESHALNDTLTKALQSTYPKLEVLVLDDCSHDKTPEIIRGFAHDGARFIEGTPTPDSWLGRNWALQQLTQAANGKLLLFADVDVKFAKDTIAEIVGVMQRDELDIASFVPALKVSGWLGRLLPPLTNFWLTLIPFQFLHARAAIGRCFAFDATAVPAAGFESSQSSVYPVYTLSKQLIHAGKRYKFFFGRTIGLIIRKHYYSNTKSTIRTAAPALANRFDVVVAVVTLGSLSLVPLVAFRSPLLALLSAVVIWLLFLRVSVAVNGWQRSLSSLLWPLQLLHELVLLIVSIVQYRFTDLRWKERQVCLPLLQAESKLPEV